MPTKLDQLLAEIHKLDIKITKVVTYQEDLKNDLSQTRQELYDKEKGLFARVDRIETTARGIKYLAGTGIIGGVLTAIGAFITWVSNLSVVTFIIKLFQKGGDA